MRAEPKGRDMHKLHVQIMVHLGVCDQITCIGYFFFGLGVVLLALIIYAMITHLTHITH